MASTSIGSSAENVAEKIVASLGYKIVCRNYRCRQGEIDIIARDGVELVFIEVKARSSSISNALESVNAAKQARLRLAAQWFISERKLLNQRCRFDVIAISKQKNQLVYQIVRDAF